MVTEKLKKEFQEWLDEQPAIVQKVGKEYPVYDQYVMKDGAPYEISCGGTIVTLYSYHENGHVSVVVMAKDKLPQAIAHEKYLGQKHGHSPEAIQKFHEGNVLMEIDPRWLHNITKRATNSRLN